MIRNSVVLWLATYAMFSASEEVDVVDVTMDDAESDEVGFTLEKRLGKRREELEEMEKEEEFWSSSPDWMPSIDIPIPPPPVPKIPIPTPPLPKVDGIVPNFVGDTLKAASDVVVEVPFIGPIMNDMMDCMIDSVDLTLNAIQGSLPTLDEFFTAKDCLLKAVVGGADGKVKIPKGCIVYAHSETFHTNVKSSTPDRMIIFTNGSSKRPSNYKLMGNHEGGYGKGSVDWSVDISGTIDVERRFWDLELDFDIGVEGTGGYRVDRSENRNDVVRNITGMRIHWRKLIMAGKIPIFIEIGSQLHTIHDINTRGAADINIWNKVRVNNIKINFKYDAGRITVSATWPNWNLQDPDMETGANADANFRLRVGPSITIFINKVPFKIYLMANAAKGKIKFDTTRATAEMTIGPDWKWTLPVPPNASWKLGITNGCKEGMDLMMDGPNLSTSVFNPSATMAKCGMDAVGLPDINSSPNIVLDLFEDMCSKIPLPSSLNGNSGSYLADDWDMSTWTYYMQWSLNYNNFSKITRRHCWHEKHTSRTFKNVLEAKIACSLDANCAAVYDRGCDNQSNDVYMCRRGFTQYTSGSSCLYIKQG